MNSYSLRKFVLLIILNIFSSFNTNAFVCNHHRTFHWRNDLSSIPRKKAKDKAQIRSGVPSHQSFRSVMIYMSNPLKQEEDQEPNNNPIKQSWLTKFKELVRKSKREPMTWDEFSTVEDKQLLQGDMVAIWVVALLLGLCNAVDDPSFVVNGGWAAPIPLVPPTLGSTLTTFSQIGLAWVLSALYNRAYQPMAVDSDEISWKVAVAIWVDHCSIRILLALVVAIASHSPVDVFTLWVQLWLTLPVLTVFRVAYGRGSRYF